MLQDPRAAGPVEPLAAPAVADDARVQAWRRTLYEQAPDAAYVLDDQGRVLEANAGFSRVLGCTQEAALQLRLWQWDVDFPQVRAGTPHHRRDPVTQGLTE